ncbi:MAG: hypothetical protein LBB20_02415 [Puniceicoccales bacterium]|jgi:hypothetical protein|nr:hypothetical protein [Puniceicoccales bacterium]
MLLATGLPLQAVISYDELNTVCGKMADYGIDICTREIIIAIICYVDEFGGSSLNSLLAIIRGREYGYYLSNATLLIEIANCPRKYKKMKNIILKLLDNSFGLTKAKAAIARRLMKQIMSRSEIFL